MTSWLIPAHVPDHWTLLEIRWDLQELRHYDSLPTRSGADRETREVRIKARVFLQILRDWMGYQILSETKDWKWVEESVCLSDSCFKY